MLMSKRARLISIGVVSLAAAGLAYAFVSLRPIEVSVAPVAENVPVRVFGLGTVGAAITELNADHGDMVTKGQVLRGSRTRERRWRGRRPRC